MARQKKELNLASLTEEQRQKLKPYKQEAFGYLADIETANGHLKDMLESAAEASGVDKALVSEFFKLAYKGQGQIDEKIERYEVIKWLNS